MIAYLLIFFNQESHFQHDETKGKLHKDFKDTIITMSKKKCKKADCHQLL